MLHPAAAALAATATRRKAGVPAAEIRYPPQPLTPAFLQRAQQVTEPMAAGIVGKLREAGWLDEVRLAGAARPGRQLALCG